LRVGVWPLRRLSPRELKRFMDRLGVSAQPLADVKEAVFRLADRELVVKNPLVTMLDFQGQKVFQVVGESVEERKPAEKVEEAKPPIPEEDVSLVAAQAGVSLEEARAALEETGGDLAQAILLLASRKR